MTRRTASAVVAALALWTLALGLTLSTSAHAATGGARAVSLSDAHEPPTVLRYVHPHRRAVVSDAQGFSCAHRAYFSDVSAYAWDGSALGSQHWTRDGLRIYWRGHGGRVTFDGAAFFNGTDAPVLVAGWCE